MEDGRKISYITAGFSGLSFARPKAVPKPPSVREVVSSPILDKMQRGGVTVPYARMETSDEIGFNIKDVKGIDPGLIKTALLLVDKIDVPVNGNLVLSQSDIAGLAEAGFGTSSKVNFSSGHLYDIMTQYAWLAYQELDKREPGKWSIWQEPEQHIIPPNELSPGLAFQLSLNSGLVVPHPEVPFEDVIGFRERHTDELIALRHHLMALTIKISNEADPRAVTMEVEQFDNSLADYLKKSRESNMRKAIASLTAEMDWSAAVRSSLSGGAAGLFSASQGFSLTATAAAVTGGLLAGLSIKSSAGLKRTDISPLRYIAKVEREFG